MSSFQQGRKGRMNELRKISSGSLIPLETTLDGEIGTMTAHLYVYTSVITSNNQNTDAWYMKDEVFIAHPGCHQLCMSCFHYMCMAAHLGSENGGQVATHMPRAEIHQN